MRLATEYEVGAIPLSEHPTPQFERKHWLCLNGEWDFYKETENKTKEYEGKILVPFSPETLNSGIKQGFVLNRGESLVYKRTVNVTKDLLLGKTLLRFGAVDSECQVFVNGEQVGAHRGGYTAFACDVTSVLVEGENEIVVRCKDEGTRNGDARGKQSDNPGTIWYTAQSGIWQTVWLESMPKKHIHKFRITTDARRKEVKIQSQSFGEEQQITVYDGNEEILCATYLDQVILVHDFQLWSPENPKLYKVKITNKAGDEAYSYFGVRSFGKCKDEKGYSRLTLNGNPYFFNGVLDQGYWSDGLLTYPSDKAALDELKMLKSMGFNTVRKHIKIEPMRWYYHCDTLGLVVWQDFVNGGGEYKPSHVAALPFLGFHHRDDDYEYFARENEGGRIAFQNMVDEILEQLYNCVSVGVWVPFNEGWGQFDSAQMTEYVRSKDGTRIIDSVSGWHDQGYGKTELLSLHIYYKALRLPQDPRPIVLSEFGGYSKKVDGHVFCPDKEFGYKKFKKTEKLVKALEKLYLKKILPLIDKGLCGCIYTQVSDVEEEINGLVTYDRKVQKVPTRHMKAVNEKIMEKANTIR